MRPSTFLSELKRYRPGVEHAAAASMKEAVADGTFVRPSKSEFLTAESVSIDYAVLEKTDHARVLPVDFGWSDVGSWETVHEVLPKDAQGNVLRGDVETIDVHNSLIRCEADMTVAAVGLSDLVCVITGDAAFIAPMERAQENKQIVEMLRAKSHSRADQPAQVYRPWGSYKTVDRGAGFQTNRVILKPGSKQSLQVHNQRSEHWVVVSGVAEVLVAGETRLLQASESIFIPAGTPHRLGNAGAEPLHVIEVQCGAYLGADDITRLEDRPKSI